MVFFRLFSTVVSSLCSFLMLKSSFSRSIRLRIKAFASLFVFSGRLRLTTADLDRQIDMIGWLWQMIQDYRARVTLEKKFSHLESFFAKNSVPQVVSLETNMPASKQAIFRIESISLVVLFYLRFTATWNVYFFSDGDKPSLVMTLPHFHLNESTVKLVGNGWLASKRGLTFKMGASRKH